MRAAASSGDDGRTAAPDAGAPATEIAGAVRRGAVTAASTVERALARIEACDPVLQAWSFVDPDAARAEAAAVDRTPARRSGILCGVPVGLKDIYDVAGMPTAAGSLAYRDRVPERDSACAARLRAAGAVIVGKNATCELAGADPAPTVNPWDAARTPGGSSAGSGVAVGAGMVPVSIGSQTGGSTLRPALYNGVVGFKPTSGRISTEGMLPLAPTLDHVGVVARTAGDVRAVLAALDEWEGDRGGAAPARVTIGILRAFFCEQADAACVAELDRVAALLRAAGHDVREVDLPAAFHDYEDARRIISCFETAQAHGADIDRRPAEYGPFIKAHVARGRAVERSDYEAALRTRERMRRDVDAALGTSAVYLTPGTPTVAPADVTTTGSPIFQGWASCGVPAVGLPTGLDDDGMPFGVQLVAAGGRDEALLDLAVACAEAIGFAARPPLSHSPEGSSR